ncbi:hypothetical protein LTR84_008070 [Exophiala bonariae]|uniref:Lipocalin/cytosolic fatty-acid binding domain-containing protein n=1 Tax=Exophiala bonariae TaxID=1690606 RepID=A0AAV9NLW0_9EURO|nr:hypothetical protein LTR84_008070 [Exophiala bonariae]
MLALQLTPWLLVAALASPVHLRRQSINENSDNTLRTVDAVWDGQCFYPEPDDDFDLEDYLGRWYQVAGTVAPFTAGCTCIFAEYSLNVSACLSGSEERNRELTISQNNGTVNVFNGCQLGDQSIEISGTASEADEVYGDEGVFRVQFPGQPPPDCPGPNYIVQGMSKFRVIDAHPVAHNVEDHKLRHEIDYDDDWAIVQSSNFTTLFVLSREQNPANNDIDVCFILPSYQ